MLFNLALKERLKDLFDRKEEYGGYRCSFALGAGYGFLGEDHGYYRISDPIVRDH